MKKIIFITLLLISGLHVTAASEYDYDFVANGIYYRINDDNASVVVVRSSDYESLTDIVIPETVEYNGARLRVTQIRPFAFLACKQLKSAVINAEKILHQSFQGINSLSKVVLGNGVRILDWNAFSGCSNLTDLEIQPGLLEIGDNAFYNCTSLQHLDIPSSVVSILGTSFMYCTGLVTIHVDENNPKYDSRGNCNALIETASNRLMVASKSTVIIPDGIEVIGRSAFYGSTLESITFPNTLKTIEDYAFAESNLRELSLPASLRSICPGAFLRCSGLTDVILPNGLQTVDDIAFKNCENLRSITFPGTLTKIMDYVVSVCNNLKCVIFKDGGNELEIGENLFFNSKNIQWISFPNSTKTIGKNALLLSEYTTPTTPTHSTYKLLKTFRMPNSVDSLGSTKLAENTYISEFSRLRAVSGDLDYSTLDLTPKTFTFGLNLSSFGRLSNNSWYADIIALLPSVSNIEDARLSPKSHIYCYSETPPVCNEKTFDISGYNSIIVHVPEGAVDAYKSAPRWSFFLNVVGDAVMPTSLTFSKAVIHMKTGEYISPRASLLPENANGGTLAFACADANIAAIVDDNKIHALQQGRTTLHCTYGALYATCEIVVDDNYTEPCDVNGDGTVDISDVNMVINMMLGKTDPTATGDVNGDGQVDISDVNAVINSMLGKENTETVETIETVTVNGVTFKMVNVKGGTFTMGATEEQLDEAKPNEFPAHEVTLSDFSIGQTEVTQELWQAVMGNNPSYISGDPQLPVEHVSWEDCKTFILALSELTGQDFRLPTEAEWEYAARGGIKGHGYKYAGGNTPDEIMWYNANSDSTTHHVATKQPNELGLYDMSGNVWEWCRDWFGDFTDAAQISPIGPDTGEYRINRGGSWYGDTSYCRVSRRNKAAQDATPINCGLRLAK